MRHFIVILVGTTLVAGCQSNKGKRDEPTNTKPAAAEPSVPATATPEATSAGSSLCADAASIYGPLENDARTLASTGARLRAKNKARPGAGPLDLIRNVESEGKACREKTAQLQSRLATMKERNVPDDEEPMRREIVSALELLIQGNQKCADSCRAGNSGSFVRLNQLLEAMPLVQTCQRLRTEHEAKCRAKGVSVATSSASGSTKTRQPDGAEMVLVPAGAFARGSNDGDPDEQPVRQITLSAFWVDKTEVTTAMYAKCVEAGGCKPAAATDRFCNRGKDGREQHPINCVRWDQADIYCKWAGARLPTEAEWEKAARGADGRTYPWGNDPPSCQYAIWYDAETETHACGELGSWRVGSKPDGASPYGAVDMAGNVWEWVADGYEAGFYGSSPDTDPRGPEKGAYRVLRGGGFGNDGEGKLRSSERFKFFSANQTSGIGFRCAMSAADPSSTDGTSKEAQ